MRRYADRKIAAKIDQVIGPIVEAHPKVEFIGEINELQKADFLGNARALLFSICWPEPFGLVMIEAMACGTPVIALSHASVPEIDHGLSGFVVNSVEEGVAAANAVGTLDRAAILKGFEQRFTAERMASDYLAVYSRLPALRQTAQLDVLAPLESKSGIRMAIPSVDLEIAAAVGG
jgi:glycosyltransferase involved in cell wall biosynthesis